MLEVDRNYTLEWATLGYLKGCELTPDPWCMIALNTSCYPDTDPIGLADPCTAHLVYYTPWISAATVWGDPLSMVLHLLVENRRVCSLPFSQLSVR